VTAPPLLRARAGPIRAPLPPPLHGRRAASGGHACLAPLLADAGGVWGATATKLRFYLATIGVFVPAEPKPRTPGRVQGSLKAVKPGGGLWVVPGHACLARLLADTGGVWGATATKLRFFLATIGVFVRAAPTPLAQGRVLAPPSVPKPGGGLWVVPGHACLAPLLANAGGVRGAILSGCAIMYYTGTALYVCYAVPVRRYTLCGCLYGIVHCACITLYLYVLIPGPCVRFRRPLLRNSLHRFF
jgi:hypothetical protein